MPRGRAPLLGCFTGAMLGIASGAILVPLNSTMLAVALPSVALDFDVGPSTVASLVTLYLGAVAIALPASGSLGDRFGHRRIFLVGVAGVRPRVGARGDRGHVQGARRVAGTPGGQRRARLDDSVALIRAAAPADRRGAAFGVFDMLVSTSAAVGPFVGGILVEGRSAGGRCSSSPCRLRWRRRSPWACAGPGTGATGSAEPRGASDGRSTSRASACSRPSSSPRLLGLRALEGSGPGRAWLLLAVPPLWSSRFVAWRNCGPITPPSIRGCSATGAVRGRRPRRARRDGRAPRDARDRAAPGGAAA